MKPFALILEEYYKSDQYFDLSDAGSTYYNDALKKTDYMFWVKGILGKIVYMTPDQYYILDAKIHNTNATTITHHIFKDTALEYKNRMLDGEKFPIPVLDFYQKTQEGRHRTYAIKMINAELEMPVLIIKDFLKTKNEIVQNVENGATLSEFKHLCEVYGAPFNENYYHRIKNRAL